MNQKYFTALKPLREGELFTETHLAALREEFGKIERVLPERLDDFHRLFESLHNPALCQLADAQIKFLSKLASIAIGRRGIDRTVAKLWPEYQAAQERFNKRIASLKH